MKSYKSKSPSETRKIAKELAGKINSTKNERSAVVIGLKGELGAGKTTFIKSFIRSLGVKKKVTSPTFLILRRFTPKGTKFKNIFHVDAYRINEKRDLSELGIEEIFKDKSNIVLIEWADRIKKILPSGVIWVKFKYGSKRDERKIIIN